VDPTAILTKLRTCLADGARLIISTDNFARLRNIAKLAARRSVVAMPDKLFAEVNFANQDVHRREYTFPELRLLLHNTGYDVDIVEYTWQRLDVPMRHLPALALEYACPIYRPHMLVQCSPAARMVSVS
jgi:hypothetical protein